MVTAILHNIRSIHNVGSIFRTADGLGVDKLFLSGYTPELIDRFGRKRQAFEKVALGAGETVDWESTDNTSDLIGKLQNNGWAVYACEPTDSAMSVDTFQPDSQQVCLTFGNEVEGLPTEIINQCHQTIKVPMQGEKSSLNVSVAFGIITQKIVDKINKI